MNEGALFGVSGSIVIVAVLAAIVLERSIAKQYRDMLEYWYFKLGEPQNEDALMDAFSRLHDFSGICPVRTLEILEFGRLKRLGKEPKLWQVAKWKSADYRVLDQVIKAAQ